MRRFHVGLAARALIAATLVLAACAARPIDARHVRGSTTGHPTPAPSTPSAGPLTVKIILADTTVIRGHPISGTAIVTNSTRRRLVISDCHNTWLQVGLANARVAFEPGWLDCLDIPGTVLAPGTTRLPFSVRTTYWACTQHSASATRDVPACLHEPVSMMPPLPAGTYRTKVVMLTPNGVRVPSPPSIRVDLTP